VITPRREGGRGGEVEHVFRHALVRDAAYAMLTPDDRALGHRLAAAWLEDAGEPDPVRLAEHHERGAAPERALAWWLRAAEHALGACDLAAVLGHVERAIACGAAGATLGELRLLAAEAHEWRGEFADAARCGREALRWLPAGDAGWLAAAGVIATASGVQGLGRELAAIADELDRALAAGDLSLYDPDALAVTCARLAEQLIIGGHAARADQVLARLPPAGAARRPGPASTGRVHAVRALRARYGGDVAGNLAEVEAAVDRFADAGDRRNLCVHRERLGYARLEIGDAAGAEALLADALDTALQLGLRNVAATARHNLGLALSRLGRHAEAIDVERAALAEFVASGNRRMSGAALEYLALIQLAAGDPVGAEASAREALQVASIAPALPLNQAESWAILGQVLLAQGRAFDALEVADHGVTMLERLGGIDDGEAIIRLTHAEALAAVGDRAAAARALERARARLLERAERIGDERLRASFLEHVPENRRTLELARSR
jgi:tetratricopeptide (TPR) repeat protein